MLVTIHEVVENLELVDVIPYEESAKRLDISSEEEGESEEIFGAQSADLVELRVRKRIIGSGEVLVDYGIRYHKKREMSIPAPLLKEFFERVAYMSLFPFLREAAFTVAARLRVNAPLLPMVRAGSVQFESLFEGVEN